MGERNDRRSHSHLRCPDNIFSQRYTREGSREDALIFQISLPFSSAAAWFQSRLFDEYECKMCTYWHVKHTDKVWCLIKNSLIDKNSIKAGSRSVRQKNCSQCLHSYVDCRWSPVTTLFHSMSNIRWLQTHHTNQIECEQHIFHAIWSRTFRHSFYSLSPCSGIITFGRLG